MQTDIAGPCHPTHHQALSASKGLTCLVALLLGATAGCGGDSERGGGPGAWSRSHPPASVTAEPIQQGSFTVEAQFVGVLEATSAADLFARTSGQIVEVSADSGDRVRAGQLLARIEPDEAQKAVEQARAALRIAEATLSQRQANLEIARATAERTEVLYEQDLLSQQDYDVARADLVGAEAQLELAEAQIEQARANLSAARLDLEKTRVIAPFDGYVGKRYLDLGDLAGTNRPVLSVVDLSTIETTLSITEKDASYISRGQPASVRTETFPGRVFEGEVARIASVFDPETNTTEAEVEVSNPDALLKPGMLADVAVAYRTEPTALLVPSSAVIETETEQYVYLVERAPQPGSDGRDAGGRGSGARNAAASSPAAGDRTGTGGSAGPPGPAWIARRVPVRILGTGAETRSLTAVEVETRAAAELVPGGRVIVLGHETLSDGAPVAVTEGTVGPSPSSYEAGGKRS